MTREHSTSEEFHRAVSRGEEAAEAFVWPLPWDGGAPTPLIVASEHKTILIYLAADTAEGWDGTTVEMISPSSSEEQVLGTVTFERCYGHRFGGPNDEVLHAHPLYGRGLTFYGAHVVHNSMWLAEEEAINSVHDCHNPTYWRRRKHYLLAFHDSVFECLAEGFHVEAHKVSFEQALTHAVAQLTV